MNKTVYKLLNNTPLGVGRRVYNARLMASGVVIDKDIGIGKKRKPARLPKSVISRLSGT